MMLCNCATLESGHLDCKNDITNQPKLEGSDLQKPTKTFPLR